MVKKKHPVGETLGFMLILMSCTENRHMCSPSCSASSRGFAANSWPCLHRATHISLPFITKALYSSLLKSSNHVPNNNFAFKWQTQSITCMGIQILGQLHHLYSLSYLSLQWKTLEDFQKLAGKYLTWFEHIRVIKIEILPLFLFVLDSTCLQKR